MALVCWNQSARIKLWRIWCWSKRMIFSLHKLKHLLQLFDCFHALALEHFLSTKTANIWNEKMQVLPKLLSSEWQMHVARKCVPDRNGCKMWNCCKTKLQFWKMLLMFSIISFFVSLTYIESLQNHYEIDFSLQKI